MTVAQADILLEEQVVEIQRLTEKTASTNSQIDIVREELAKTAKEVNSNHFDGIEISLSNK